MRFAVYVVVIASMTAPAVGASRKADRDRGGQQRVEVAGVVGTADSEFVVILSTQLEPKRFLPIWIGEMEAMNIQMRLERVAPPRPLTLNLLESVLESGQIELVSIHIDGLRKGLYLGKLRLRQRNRIWAVDARPSDAIGLAVARAAPIFVSRKVLQQASVSMKDVMDSKEKAEAQERDSWVDPMNREPFEGSL